MFSSYYYPFATSSLQVRQNWHPKTDGARLIMCLILLKDESLLRNETLTRLALEGDKKAFWTLVAKLFNGTNPELDELVGSAELLERYKALGLSPIHTGYEATAEKCEVEFKTYRSAHTKAQTNFVQSGMGDDGRSIREHVEEDEDYAVTIFASGYHCLIECCNCNIAGTFNGVFL